jgi:hypothetical protein
MAYGDFGVTQTQELWLRKMMRDNAVISFQKGLTGTGLQDWQVLPEQPTPCLLVQKSGLTVDAQGVQQAYSAQAQLGGEITLDLKHTRYRVEITQYKRELDEAGNQQIENVFKYDIVSVAVVRDYAGRNVSQVVGLKNAD